MPPTHEGPSVDKTDDQKVMDAARDSVIAGSEATAAAAQAQADRPLAPDGITRVPTADELRDADIAAAERGIEESEKARVAATTPNAAREAVAAATETPRFVDPTPEMTSPTPVPTTPGSVPNAPAGETVTKPAEQKSGLWSKVRSTLGF